MLDSSEGYVTEDGRKIGGVVMEMKNITLRFGGVVAIKDISFDIREGEIRAIIGPNGRCFPARLPSYGRLSACLVSSLVFIAQSTYWYRFQGGLYERQAGKIHHDCRRCQTC